MTPLDFGLSTVVGAALALSLAAVGFLAFADSLRGQRAIRRYLERRLMGTRMPTMLIRRGVSPHAHAAHSPTSALSEQVRACEHCASKTECDSVAWDDRQRDYAFCPNRYVTDRVRH